MQPLGRGMPRRRGRPRGAVGFRQARQLAEAALQLPGPLGEESCGQGHSRHSGNATRGMAVAWRKELGTAPVPPIAVKMRQHAAPRGDGVASARTRAWRCESRSGAPELPPAPRRRSHGGGYLARRGVLRTKPCHRFGARTPCERLRRRMVRGAEIGQPFRMAQARLIGTRVAGELHPAPVRLPVVLLCSGRGAAHGTYRGVHRPGSEAIVPRTGMMGRGTSWPTDLTNIFLMRAACTGTVDGGRATTAHPQMRLQGDGLRTNSTRNPRSVTVIGPGCMPSPSARARSCGRSVCSTTSPSDCVASCCA